MGRRDVVTIGLGAVLAALPLAGTYRAAVYPIDSGTTLPSFIVTCCLVPVAVSGLVMAVNNSRSPVRWWTLGTIAVAGVVGVIVFGPDWLYWGSPLAVLVLVLMRPPWSFVLYAAILVLVGGTVIILGYGFSWALYLSLSVTLWPPPLALLAELGAKMRELNMTQQAFVREAIAHERSMAERELHHTLGSALETIIQSAANANAAAQQSPDLAERQLVAMVGQSRRAVADARQTVRRYQRVSVGSELDNAALLLSAAGIPTNIVGTPGQLRATLSAEMRHHLRAEVARLLGCSRVTSCVLAVETDRGRLSISVRVGGPHNGLEATR
jgi:two-component system sensor histidine kinase DesK